MTGSAYRRHGCARPENGELASIWTPSARIGSLRRCNDGGDTASTGLSSGESP